MWRNGERRAALQPRPADPASRRWAWATLFSVRNLQLVYTVYTDPLLILAAALVLAQFPQLQKAPRAQNAALGLMMIYLVWGQLEPVRRAITRGASGRHLPMAAGAHAGGTGCRSADGEAGAGRLRDPAPGGRAGRRPPVVLLRRPLRQDPLRRG